LTVTDKQTIGKKLNINHKNTHINTIQIKENKQLNTQLKQNYPDSVALLPLFLLLYMVAFVNLYIKENGGLVVVVVLRHSARK